MEQILKEAVKNAAGAESRRLFHGRGKCFPGFAHLNIDYFRPVILIQTYQDENEDAWFLELATQLAALPELTVAGVLLQRRYLPKPPMEVILGSCPETLTACENGLQYKLNLSGNRNVGFFLDTRELRSLVRARAAGRRVLNLFAYTCSFSVAATAGKAAGVVNMDMSKAALRVGRENHLINQLPVGEVDFFAFNVMKSFGRMIRGGPYDLVIIDPPTYQGKHFDVEMDYAKVVARLPEMSAPGALVVACLNAPFLGGDFLGRLFRDPRFKLEGELHAPPEFREADGEGALKVHLYRFDG